jgi:hypothetical protein
MNHNINDPRHPWSRLTAAAREVRAERDESAPYGFATRIAALAFAHERRVSSLFERFALRAVGVATLLALFSVVLNYQALSTTTGTVVAQNEETDMTAPPVDDAVALVLDLAD